MADPTAMVIQTSKAEPMAMVIKNENSNKTPRLIHSLAPPPPPSSSSSPSSSSHPPIKNADVTEGHQKSKICRDFVWGICDKGNECKFIHFLDVETMKDILKFCHDHQNRSGCTRPDCTYLHTSREEENLFMATGIIPKVLANRYAAICSAAVSEYPVKFQPPPPLSPLPKPYAPPPSASVAPRRPRPSNQFKPQPPNPFPPPTPNSFAPPPQNSFAPPPPNSFQPPPPNSFAPPPSNSFAQPPPNSFTPRPRNPFTPRPSAAPFQLRPPSQSAVLASPNPQQLISATVLRSLSLPLPAPLTPMPQQSNSAAAMRSLLVRPHALMAPPPPPPPPQQTNITAPVRMTPSTFSGQPPFNTPMFPVTQPQPLQLSQPQPPMQMFDPRRPPPPPPPLETDASPYYPGAMKRVAGPFEAGPSKIRIQECCQDAQCEKCIEREIRCLQYEQEVENLEQDAAELSLTAEKKAAEYAIGRMLVKATQSVKQCKFMEEYLSDDPYQELELEDLLSQFNMNLSIDPETKEPNELLLQLIRGFISYQRRAQEPEVPSQQLQRQDPPLLQLCQNPTLKPEVPPQQLQLQDLLLQLCQTPTFKPEVPPQQLQLLDLLRQLCQAPTYNAVLSPQQLLLQELLRHCNPSQSIKPEVPPQQLQLQELLRQLCQAPTYNAELPPQQLQLQDLLRYCAQPSYNLPQVPSVGMDELAMMQSLVALRERTNPSTQTPDDVLDGMINTLRNSIEAKCRGQMAAQPGRML